MTSQARRAGASLLRTIAQVIDPGGESERSLLYAKDVQGTPQFFARDPNFTHQISGIECNLWDKPLNPSVYDDEFDSTTLDPAWTPSAGWVQGGIDPYASFAGGDIRYELHTERRPSWLMVQRPTGVGATLTKSFNFAGDFFVYTRVALSLRSSGTGATAEDQLLMSISADPFDTNNRINIQLGCISGSNNFAAQFYRTTGGANTFIGNTANDFSGSLGMPAIEALGITRRGQNYDGWAFGASGHALWLGTTTHTFTPGAVLLNFLNTTDTNPGNRILGVDFIRFREGSAWLP